MRTKTLYEPHHLVTKICNQHEAEGWAVRLIVPHNIGCYLVFEMPAMSSVPLYGSGPSGMTVVSSS